MKGAAPPIREGGLSLRAVGKTYRSGGRTIPALRDVSLSVDRGELVAVIGHSGCGKSTLLRLIAGLEPEYAGAIAFEGGPVRGPGRERGMLFQEHRLFPWLTVEQNVSLALRRTALGRTERKASIARQLELVGLADFAAAFPAQLSGGMAQRVAIARALAAGPRLLLLDEPFGALDAFNRLIMQQALQGIRAERRIPMVLVTHDVEEAAFLADRVVVLTPRPGRVRRTVDVGLPYPRDRTSPEFVAIKRLLLEELDLFRPSAAERRVA